MGERRDLMFQDEIRSAVGAAYRSIGTGAGRKMAERFYSRDELALVPEGAVRWALGVGNPVASAPLAAGDRVLDVGCGGGIDTVLAARRVGARGRVYGLDLLEEMCERTRRAAQIAGLADRCEAVQGPMEDIPLPDASVDVVISNGAINLSARKSRTLAEIARVLRPGGALAITDLVVDDDLPPEVLASEAAWAGCIAGAVSRRVLAKKLASAGFEHIEMTRPERLSIDDVAVYPLFPPELIALLRRELPPDRHDRVAAAITVCAQLALRADEDGRSPHSTSATGRRPLEEIPAAEVKAPGVTVRNLKRVEDIELKVMDVQPRSTTPYHTHAHAHEGVVVSGEGALRLADRSDVLRPGDVFSVAPQEPHAIACTGRRTFRIVCMDCFIE